MPQIARPMADVDNSGWSPTPLYPHVNTVSPNDGSPVACPVPPGGYFDVQLQPLAATHRQPQTLTVRLDEASPGAALVTFLLLKVTSSAISTVGSYSVQPTGTFTSYNLVLAPNQIALLDGNYSNLRVRVSVTGEGTGSYYGSGIGSSGGGSVNVPCCPNNLPLILFVSFTGTLAGLGSVMLTWDGSGNWIGNGSACGGGVVVNLSCDEISGNFLLGTEGAAVSGSHGSLQSCSPLSITGSGTVVAGPCAGGYDWEVSQ